MGNVKLDTAGIAAIAKGGAVSALVKSAAEEIAANVRGIMVDGIPGDTSLPVEVSMTTTDRAHASVTLAHPSGAAVQAKHGALTRAASAAGASVNGG